MTETGAGAVRDAGGGTSGGEAGWPAKILDDGLRRFAEAGGRCGPGEAGGAGRGRRRVLIEVATPRPQVEMGTAPRPGREIQWPVRVVGPPATPATAPVEEVGRLLRALLGTQPVWLEVAQSFVAEVTSEQLGAVAHSPFVRAIHLNRQLG